MSESSYHGATSRSPHRSMCEPVLYLCNSSLKLLIFAGSKFVQLRTRFATSDFWDKIVHAVDFRNRFAERPYVCQELLHEDEVVVCKYLIKPVTVYT